MTVKVKICGITDAAAMAAARQGGATFAGLVFYPPSPRNVSPEEATQFIKEAGRMKLVGVFVDPDDEDLENVLAQVPLNLIQLHGHESPSRVREIKNKFNLPVIKAIPVANAGDIDLAKKFERIADVILFDTAPIDGDLLPGGNARTFDHTLLAGKVFELPWGLSGGLNVDNLERAINESGTKMVDVSSGVEQNPGRKDPRLIKEFLEKANTF